MGDSPTREGPSYATADKIPGDFLHNPKQCVRLNNTLSEDLHLTAGVPQGTKLGPIGFQILINDAAADAEPEYWKYVDDLTFAENNTGTIQEHL